MDFNKNIQWDKKYKAGKVYHKKNKNGIPYLTGNLNKSVTLMIQKNTADWADEGEYTLYFVPVNWERVDKNNQPTKETPTKKKSNKISKKQRKRLFAIMNNNPELTKDELKEHLEDKYNIDSTKDIDWRDYDDICKWAEDYSNEIDLDEEVPF